ncbi:Probable plastid-lipid-associated protein 8, chloroplastic isoform 2 [Zea mays]|uniref:PAP fibrillin family protein n=5 Tax=Zea mays TaxID=4577 RepID=A0A1D6E043_MAIZE|nr:Probable plastid-lipid-associated protein 8, chloroplastic isoform 2 [Zea mays]ONM14121.1 PAP fibrillin family protein [Zea mays]|eukprot:NP_001338050.1 uncharacterized protein LOC100285627 isoform 2 [Zea mays]
MAYPHFTRPAAIPTLQASSYHHTHEEQAMKMSASVAAASPTLRFSSATHPLHRPLRRRLPSVRCSLAAAAGPGVRAPPELVDSILSKVKGTDRGVLLPKDGHQEVAEVALQLGKYCIDDPVKSPLIFGEWEVVYCSVPTSPGGLYRTPLGRLVFKTDEMVQAVEAPDVVRNKVSFSVFGLEGAVSLKGKLNVLDSKWIQVVFEAPELKVGSLGFQYGGESEVKLEITYVDEKIRLGRGSRGSLFVFLRR